VTVPADFRLTDFEEVLTTTRAVRRRLDLTRPVPEQVLHDCLELALQAPTGADAEDWRFLLIGDPDLKHAIGLEYQRVFDEAVRPKLAELAEGRTLRGMHKDLDQHQRESRQRVYETAAYLAENLCRMPWLVLVCATRPDSDPRLRSGLYGSIYPAVWSFQLALRSRGLGSVITTLHLRDPEPVARLLDLPGEATQCALLPVAYTLGTDFKPARRRPVEEVTFRDTWGRPFALPKRAEAAG
jgi:nitroreductase